MEEPGNQANLPYSREFDDRAMAYFLDNTQILGDVLRLQVPEIAAKMRFEDAKKIDRTFIPSDLQKKTSDLIYSVPYGYIDIEGKSKEAWVYILIENKSERTPLVTFQLFLYIFLILLTIWREWEQAGTAESKRKFPIIIPLVFYIGHQKWDGPLELSQCFETIPELSRFIPSWDTLLLNLNVVTDEELVRANTLASQVFRVIKMDGQPYEEYEAILSDVLESVVKMPYVTDGNRLEATWLLLLQAYNTLSKNQVKEAHKKISDTVTKTDQAVRREYMIREHSYAAQLKREGEMIGKGIGEKLGVELGVGIGIRQSLLIFIETRFGQPSEEIVEQVNSVDLDTVTDWIRKIVSVNSLDELGIIPPSK